MGHSHDDEDEAFFVIEGTVEMRFQERTVEMAAGDIIVVPRRTEHLPVGTPTSSVLLIEPNTTVNTGETDSELGLTSTVPRR